MAFAFMYRCTCTFLKINLHNLQGERPYHSFFSPCKSFYTPQFHWSIVLTSGGERAYLQKNDSYLLLSFVCNIYPVIPQFLQPQNCYVDGFEEIGEWDNKMAHGMLPLDQECEAFGEKMPERCNVPPHAPGED